MKRHKFLISNGGGPYTIIVACEYCGLVSYSSNRNDIWLQDHEEMAKKECPHGDEDGAKIIELIKKRIKNLEALNRVDGDRDEQIEECNEILNLIEKP